MSPRTIAASLLLASLIAAPAAQAQHATTLNVTVKDHRFQPKQIAARANAPIAIRVKNADSGRPEFESSNPQVEQVIGGGSTATVKVGPLKPGRYEFYDDFNQQDTLVLMVK